MTLKLNRTAERIKISVVSTEMRPLHRDSCIFPTKEKEDENMQTRLHHDQSSRRSQTGVSMKDQNIDVRITVIHAETYRLQCAGGHQATELYEWKLCGMKDITSRHR